MGAEKVSMNIVVVGQVQSAKVVETVTENTSSNSQLMVSCVNIILINFNIIKRIIILIGNLKIVK